MSCNGTAQLRALVWLVLALASCSQLPAAPARVDPVSLDTPLPTHQVRTTASPVEAVATAASETPKTTVPEVRSLDTTTPSLAPSRTPLPLPSSTPDPYAPLTIGALAARPYGGGEILIEETLEQAETFTRYLIKYPSDGLTIYGYMNVPIEGWEFPVAVVLHGYIPPAEYETIAYTRRYADALAEAGYFVFHPNFRNYPPSDSGPDPFRTGYAIDVLNLIAIIRTQSQDPAGTLRRLDEDNIHLWGHSMGGGIALRVITVNNEGYLRSAVLYGSMSGDEVLNYERIRFWTDGRGGQFELAAPAEAVAAISPINFLERIRAPISIHHSDADTVVPPAWSADLCARLLALAHPTECFTYNDLPHTFRGNGDRLFIERTIRFFDSQ